MYAHRTICTHLQYSLLCVGLCMHMCTLLWTLGCLCPSVLHLADIHLRRASLCAYGVLHCVCCVASTNKCVREFLCTTGEDSFAEVPLVDRQIPRVWVGRCNPTSYPLRARPLHSWLNLIPAGVRSSPPTRCFPGPTVDLGHQLFKGWHPSFLKKKKAVGQVARSGSGYLF